MEVEEVAVAVVVAARHLHRDRPLALPPLRLHLQDRHLLQEELRRRRALVRRLGGRGGRLGSRDGERERRRAAAESELRLLRFGGLRAGAAAKAAQ